MKNNYLWTGRGWQMILLLFSICFTARAQAPNWQAGVTALSTGSGSYGNAVLDVRTDASGNVYLTGQFYGSIQLGSITLPGTGGGSNLYVAKWSRATGTYIWAVAAGAGGDMIGWRLALSGSSVYVVGHFTGGTATFGTTALTNGSSTTSTADGFIAKLTDAGSSASFTWAQRLGGLGSDEAYGLAASGSSVYVAGFYSGSGSFGSTTLASAGNTDAYVAKLTDTGSAATFGWAVRAGGTGVDEAYNLALSGSTLYLTGAFTGAGTFGASTLTSVGSTDGFVAKLTDAGSSATFSWAQALGGSSSDETISATVSGGSVYVTGYFYSPTCTVGSTTLTNAGGNTGTIDVFVAKLTDAGSTGSFTWAQRMGGPLDENIVTVAVSGSKVYTVGSFGYSSSNATVVSQATFGSSTVTSAGGRDVFVTRLTDMGSTASFDWVQRAGGTTNDYGNALALSGTSVYAVGFFNSASITFGASTLTNSYGSLGASASFLAYLTDPVLPTRAATALVGASIYPNPARGIATVRVPAGLVPATLTLLDALGRTVRTATAPTSQDFPLDLTGLAPGVYALRVQVGEGQAVQRLVAE